LYSLRYGTLPIVHATGGLEDTVDQYDKFTGMGTGFKFIGYNSQALMDSVDDAVTLYYTKREHFKKMVKTAMKKDFSWYNSVQRYLKVYGEKSTFQDSKIITKKQPASKHVFLSYVQNDIDIVTQIKNLLIRNDINVWQDIDNIEPGDNLEVKILEAIEGSYHFIPCFSESYWDRESTFMNRELRWAIDKYRNMPLGSRWFIPALLEDCQIPPIGIGFGQTIRDLLWADLSKGNINILVDAILNN
jgi:hypothetical protein